MVIRSVVNGVAHAAPHHLVQGALLGAHALSPPFDNRGVHCRVGPLLDGLLLALPSVLELSVAAEVFALGGTCEL